MSLTIQQIEALARRNLRGEYLANFNDRANNLFTQCYKALRHNDRVPSVVGHTHVGFQAWMVHPERREKERLIRTECRVALAALFAKLYKEQQEQAHESDTAAG